MQTFPSLNSLHYTTHHPFISATLLHLYPLLLYSTVTLWLLYNLGDVLVIQQPIPPQTSAAPSVRKWFHPLIARFSFSLPPCVRRLLFVLLGYITIPFDRSELTLYRSLGLNRSQQYIHPSHIIYLYSDTLHSQPSCHPFELVPPRPLPLLRVKRSRLPPPHRHLLPDHLPDPHPIHTTVTKRLLCYVRDL